MTVNELVKRLIELQKEDYGKLNVVLGKPLNDDKMSELWW